MFQVRSSEFRVVTCGRYSELGTRNAELYSSSFSSFLCSAATFAVTSGGASA